MTRNIILAPHVDDETIGCHSLLSRFAVSVVFYFFEVTKQRRDEAIKAAEFYKFCPVFVGDDPKDWADVVTDWGTGNDSVIYLPSVKDSHPHHRQVNSFFRTKASGRRLFYSVDLNSGAKSRALESKRSHLDLLYPSQASLWERDASYYLFENIQHLDYDAEVELQYMVPGLGNLRMVIPEYCQGVAERVYRTADLSGTVEVSLHTLADQLIQNHVYSFTLNLRHLTIRQ